MLRTILIITALFAHVALAQDSGEGIAGGDAESGDNRPPVQVEISSADLAALAEQIKSIAANTAPDPSEQADQKQREKDTFDLQAIDLLQQSRMATWTFGLFIVSLVGTVVSAIGVVLLVRNLDIARQSLWQTRAYMTSKEFKIIAGDLITKDPFVLKWTVENSGDSPALNVKSMFMGSNQPEGAAPAEFNLRPQILQDTRCSNLGRGKGVTGVIEFDAEWVERAWATFNFDTLVAHALITYEDVHGQIFETQITRQIELQLLPGWELEAVIRHARLEIDTYPFGTQNSERKIGQKKPNAEKRWYQFWQ